MVTALALAGTGVAVTFTGRRVVTAAVALSRDRTRIREYRDFTDAFAVELLVGARPVDAAEQALTTGHGITAAAGREVHRIRLGAEIGTGPSADTGTDGGPAELQVLLRM